MNGFTALTRKPGIRRNLKALIYCWLHKINLKSLWNWFKSAFVLFFFSVFVAMIMFVVILGAMEMRKERVRLDYIHQYRIDKVKTMLEGKENLP
jgi:energy-coupling factor transporter transmembrane protein EcfT